MKTSNKLTIAYAITFGAGWLTLVASSLPDVFVWVALALVFLGVGLGLAGMGAFWAERRVDQERRSSQGES